VGSWRPPNYGMQRTPITRNLPCWQRCGAADAERCAARTDPIGVVWRGGLLLVASAFLAACDRSSDSEKPVVSETTMTAQEQIAEMQRQARLVMEEMKSLEGPNLRAQVERGGQALIEASPDPIDEGEGFYTVEGRLLADNASITVYVPNAVTLSDGTEINVVAGRQGYLLSLDRRRSLVRHRWTPLRAVAGRGR
jgi:hypothetical protein